MGVFFKEVMFGGPNVIVATLIGEYSLFKSILEKRVLRIANPRPRELMFVEAAKFHEKNDLCRFQSYHCNGASTKTPKWRDRVRSVLIRS
jgi:hypothetical protein